MKRVITKGLNYSFLSHFKQSDATTINAFQRQLKRFKDTRVKRTTQRGNHSVKISNTITTN